MATAHPARTVHHAAPAQGSRPTTTTATAEAHDRRPRSGLRHRSDHHAVTACGNPPTAASTSRIAASTKTI
jgi:hypothetical protein